MNAPAAAEGQEAPRRRPHAGVLLLAGIAVVACTAWALIPRSDPLAGMPAVDLSESAPSVVRAITAARDDVQSDPDSAETWGRLGMMLLAHDFNPAATAAFERAARIDPARPLWPYLCGVSLSVVNPQAAVDHYRRGVELAPADHAMRLRLAEALLERHDLAAAEEQFRAVLGADERSPRAELGMARIAVAREEWEGALSWAQRADEHAPGQHAILAVVVQAAHRVGGLEMEAEAEALSQLQRLPEEPTAWEDPAIAMVLSMRRDPDSQAARARELLASGEAASATGILQNVVRDHPDRAEFVVELARAHELVGAHGSAARVLEEGLARHPESSELHRLRGLVHVGSDELDLAVQEFQEAVRLKADDGRSYEHLGECLRRLLDFDAAISAWESAVRLRPDDGSTHAGLGRTLLDAGRHADAAAPLRRALQLSPNVPEWHDWLQAAERE